jgi:hypothetical protein
MMNYSFFLHAHRFSVWTAARAVNRDFIDTGCIQKAIEETNLPEKIEHVSKLVDLNSSTFDDFHKEAVNAIIEFLKMELGPNSYKATYGRAAKVVAIYIKTRYVLTDPTSNLSKFAHPPIDSILLRNLAKEHKNVKVGHERWTKLDENNYFDLINRIRETVTFNYFWELERFWLPK